MTIRISILFSLLVFYSCNSSDIDNLEKRNENWCWFVDKITGKGEWVPIGSETTLPDGDYTLFFCNGNIRQTGKLKDKKDCDTIFMYDMKGRVISKVFNLPDGTKKEIMPEGKYVSHYATCEISGYGEVKNGKIVGTRIEYYRNGKTKWKSITSSDTTLVMKFYESGMHSDSLLYINDKENGQCKTWYENGNLKECSFFNNGTPDSTCIIYHENGKIDKLANYKNGVLNGLSLSYFENGKIETEIYLVNGKPEGLAKGYHENGQLANKLNFSNGVYDGECWTYHPNGKLKMLAKVEMGTPVSYKEYDDVGKLIEELKDGTKIDHRKK